MSWSYERLVAYRGNQHYANLLYCNYDTSSSDDHCVRSAGLRAGPRARAGTGAKARAGVKQQQDLPKVAVNITHPPNHETNYFSSFYSGGGFTPFFFSYWVDGIKPETARSLLGSPPTDREEFPIRVSSRPETGQDSPSGSAP